MYPDSRRAVVLVAVLIASMGCQGDESSPEDLAVAAVRSGAVPGNLAATVTYGKGEFAPTRVEIEAGQTVAFSNESDVPVWPASHIHPTHAIYPDFDAKGAIPSGAVWDFTFELPGFWRFHNHLDPRQTGLVVVRGDPVERSTAPLQMDPAAVSFEALPDVSHEDARRLLKDDTTLDGYLQTYGPAATVASLAKAAAREGADCHHQAHVLGRMAYERFGALALSLAGHECHSGSFHGATEAMFRDRGTLHLESDIDDLCGSAPNRFYRHQCLHGIGHGLMAWTSYELHDALALCDGLKEPTDRESCYSGVFMENVAGGLSGSMGHVTEYLSDDPHYPCNILEDRYLAPCYFYQTSRMVVVFGGNFYRVADACAEVPYAASRGCFESMGRDVGGRSRGAPQKSIMLCSTVEDPRNRRYCLDGAVQDYFWDPSGADDAVRFCWMLEDSPAKGSCYTTIIQRARQVLKTEEQRENFCAKVEEPWNARCDVSREG